MNISSLVVRAHPDQLAAVEAALAAIPGLEIHAVTAEARIAATIEDENSGRAADTYVGLHHIPGVLAVTLIYQYDDTNEAAAVPPGLLDRPTANADVTTH